MHQKNLRLSSFIRLLSQHGWRTSLNNQAPPGRQNLLSCESILPPSDFIGESYRDRCAK
jgi:hypothetical protein